MRLVKKLEIASREKIIGFLNSEPVGRIGSIDSNGYPQVIPMNFVYVVAADINSTSRTNIMSDAVYMHSYHIGEKLENIKANSRVGFEVDRHICFLPSYYFHPTDASQADTLYISVVIKGTASIVENSTEKAEALNSLMNKYQIEGRYEPLYSHMPSVQEVTVIKILPVEMRGKYKIGQQWAPAYRLKMAKCILSREERNLAKQILDYMGVELLENDDLKIRQEPFM
jgi:nitroimidazol reductase NimA-like FMN-containing flavoprotein (pyridoxamine 5'-phosphate oxidase superfamily)